jgi:hypothetical protein
MVKFFLKTTLLLLLASTLLAAEDAYLFRVTRMDARVSAEFSGIVQVNYEIDFVNPPGSHPIDVVDIGMPNGFYKTETAQAEIDGRTCPNIRRSQYVDPGIEVHLDAGTIPPGGSGTLRFSIQVANLVFPAEKDPDYASLVFTTTWFGKEYVSGTADSIQLRIDLPPRSQPGTSRYYMFGRDDYRPTAAISENGRVSYLWRWENVRPDQGFTGGVGFPRTLVAETYTPPRTTLRGSLWNLLSAAGGFLLLLSPFLIPLLIIVLVARASRCRLKRYLPPAIGIESGGIKRGLTPPEAALLQELPLQKVLLLVIYGMVRKGVLEIKPAGEKEYRFHKIVPIPAGVELQNHEKEFLTAVSSEEQLSPAGIQTCLTGMIKDLQAKMRGFSSRETNAYYRSIMAKAWQQVKNAPADKLPAELADNLEWLTLDEEYEKKIGAAGWDGAFMPGSTPYWYDRLPHDTVPGRMGAGKPGGGISASATRFVNAMQGFSTTLLGDPASFTSAITRVTNPPPVPSSTSSRWSGASG